MPNARGTIKSSSSATAVPAVKWKVSTMAKMTSAARPIAIGARSDWFSMLRE